MYDEMSKYPSIMDRIPKKIYSALHVYECIIILKKISKQNECIGLFYLVELQISTLLKEIKMKLYFDCDRHQLACSLFKIFLGLSYLSEPP